MGVVLASSFSAALHRVSHPEFRLTSFSMFRARHKPGLLEGIDQGRRFINRPFRGVRAPLESYPQLWNSPVNLPPMVPGAPPSQGTWYPVGTNSGPGYAVFGTQVTPSPGAPPVAVAWVNQAETKVSLFAGTSQPGGSWPEEGYVPPALQGQLLAAFEGGFQFSSSNGGWYAAGRVGIPLRNGAASLVSYDNGTLNIGAWGSDVTMTPAVYAVRQNLIPLVANGQVVPQALQDPLSTWGFSLGNLLSTWRSGVGITASGNLIWAGGPGLSPENLGQVLVWAGAIRGMQLDINPDWVSFATFTHNYGSTTGSNLLSTMYFSPSHYLSPFWRDFVAVFAR